MKTINPGKLRHKIEIHSPPSADADNAYGEQSKIWVTYKTVRASKEPLIGRELYAALTADTLVRVKFKMRFVKGVHAGMRIKHNDSLYEIVSAQNVEAAGVELVCYCKEV
ncbi:MAG: phage head closure protein [Defluviitaleaceae bacterium]|nr:phage head closure protein [Defluviitaleaceae bacterium]MCL2263780.1 phage head closure protein [Defluviitaleaceae bacterium]